MATLERRAAVRAILANRADTLVVTGLGGTCWDVAAAGDSPNTFYLWGAMGAAAMTGLGIALAQPGRRVVVVTGDGELLMGLGSLATIAVQKPENLAIAVIDNELFAETGRQPTHTGAGVNLDKVAAAVGFRDAMVARDEAGLAKAVTMLRTAPGPVLAVLKVDAEKKPLVMPPRDGAYLKDRFREALLGTAAIA
ncbi:MAG: aldehyde dehydrogenase [Alphaproteobacteria bacterium]|nr:aldehyde dehydrogenase [Alphaproteobacteria bacterium]